MMARVRALALLAIVVLNVRQARQCRQPVTLVGATPARSVDGFCWAAAELQMRLPS